MRTVSLMIMLGAGVWLMSGSAVLGQAYSFQTAAGRAGQPGVTDGINSAALFQHPFGVATDGAGHVLVADTYNHVIRMLTPVDSGWVVTTIAGSAGASGSSDGAGNAARFMFPYGIAADSSGNVYVSDTYNHTIRKLSLEGADWVVTTIAGSPGVPGNSDAFGNMAMFRYPAGLAVGGDGMVYVADWGNHSIRQVAPWGSVLTVAGSGSWGVLDGTNTGARFQSPSGVAVDNGGRLFVADTGNCAIRQITPVGGDWVVQTIAGVRGYQGTTDGTNNHALFSYASGIAIDARTNLYVADTLVNCTIRRLSPVGTNWVVTTIGGLPTVAGSLDGIGSGARFDQPHGIAIDDAGRVWVADTGNHTIRYGRFGYTLQQSWVGNKLVLSWPAAAVGFTLETSASVASGATWTALTSGIVLSGTNFVRTNTLGTGPAFFRLRQ